MATQQEREAFLRGWHAAMDEVLAVLATEAREWKDEESEAAASGEYKLPGSFALEEVRGSFKGRHDLLTWIMRIGPAAQGQGQGQGENDPALVRALDALIENKATDEDRKLLGLLDVSAEEGEQP